MELKYSSRGVYQHPSNANPILYISNYKYLEFPLSVLYTYNEKFEIELGFAPDILLSEYYENQYGPLDPDYSDELRRFGLNVMGGLNYYVMEKLSLGIRYTLSAMRVTPDRLHYRYVLSGWFHEVFSVSAKYYILR